MEAAAGQEQGGVEKSYQVVDTLYIVFYQQ
jgi:hypothetical protein